MFNSGEYSRTWGEGITSPIFKKGDVDEASNDRGITLISVLAKVYFQLLFNRLTDWSNNYEKISSNQFGFQKGKSVIDRLHSTYSYLQSIKHRSKTLLRVH